MRTPPILASAITVAALCGFASPVEARPVSYPGGVTIITENDGVRNFVLLHYTPRADYSVGLRIEHIDDIDATLIGPQVNYLVKRWNGEDSQANIYVFAGVGGVTGDVEGPAGFVTVSSDWETRQLFVSYAARGVFIDDVEDQLRQTARAGFAPYVAEAGGLHTWIMVQVDRFDGRNDDWKVTPLLRFFKGSALAEVGVSLDGDPLVNFTYRF